MQFLETFPMDIFFCGAGQIAHQVEKIFQLKTGFYALYCRAQSKTKTDHL